MAFPAKIRKTLLITPELFQKIEEKAKAEVRSTNNMIEYAIKFYLEVTKKK